MVLDWRIRKTFNSISLDLKEVKLISSQDLRMYYMTATGNLSKSSYLDFVDRCMVLGFINSDKKPSLAKTEFSVSRNVWVALKNED